MGLCPALGETLHLGSITYRTGEHHIVYVPESTRLIDVQLWIGFLLVFVHFCSAYISNCVPYTHYTIILQMLSTLLGFDS